MKRCLCTLLLLLPLIGGCGHATSIDTRALVVGIAVDKGTKAGELRYTFQIPSPASLGGGGGSASGNKFYYPSAQAPSLTQAISYMADRTSRDIYLGQFRILLVALDVPAADRDRLWREEQRLGELDHSEWVAFAQAPAAKMLQVPASQEQLPSLFYLTYFNCSTCPATATGVAAWKLAQEEMEPGKTVTLPVVQLVAGQYDIGSVASFHDGEKPVTFDRAQSRYVEMALGQMHKGIVKIQTPVGSAVVRSLSAKATRRGALAADGKVHLYLDVQLDGTIAQAPARAERITPAVAGAVAQATADRVKAGLLDTIAKAQKAGVDPFRFGHTLYHTEGWAAQRVDRWPAAFAQADVHVQVKVRLPNQGVSV